MMFVNTFNVFNLWNAVEVKNDPQMYVTVIAKQL